MIKVIELFAGIGAFRKALQRQNIKHEIIGISEIDKYAAQSYNAIYGDTYNFGDIKNIDLLPYADLWTYGFPCQDISVAGKQAGIKEGTRSGLLYEVQRLLINARDNNILPKYLIMENVKNLVGKKFKPKFDEYLQWLNDMGYNNYWQVLNAKDYGIPQNRERVFCISIRKDVDKNTFSFPKKQELKIRLKDILEDFVEDKYYINNEKTEKLLKQIAPQIKDSIETCDMTINEPTVKDISNCITARYDCGISNLKSSGTAVVEAEIKQLGNIAEEKNFKNPQAGRVYDSCGISPTLNTMREGNRQPKIINNPLKGKTERGWRCEQTIYSQDTQCVRTLRTTTGDPQPKIIELPVIAGSRGRNPNNPSSRKAGEYVEQRLELNKNGTTNTITTVQKDNYLLTQNFRIRKLTPKECWRLMGFDDEDIDKCISAGVSNTQLYKQAGNSIVVNVLEEVFKELFERR